MKNDKEKLYDLLDYIKSRVECVETADYPFQMAYSDIVFYAGKLDDRKELTT